MAFDTFSMDVMSSIDQKNISDSLVLIELNKYELPKKKIVDLLLNPIGFIETKFVAAIRNKIQDKNNESKLYGGLKYSFKRNGISDLIEKESEEKDFLKSQSMAIEIHQKYLLSLDSEDLNYELSSKSRNSVLYGYKEARDYFGFNTRIGYVGPSINMDSLTDGRYKRNVITSALENKKVLYVEIPMGRKILRLQKVRINQKEYVLIYLSLIHI